LVFVIVSSFVIRILSFLSDMNARQTKLWRGLSTTAQRALSARDYTTATLRQRVTTPGVDAGELVGADKTKGEMSEVWIPGVEIFSRKLHAQRHRGIFGEFARRDEGILAEIGLWPMQWATARMFARTAKGFHLHPPNIPEGKTEKNWLKKLFVDEPQNYSLRPYDREQWDVIFFVQGVAEMILRECRAGLPVRTMRFFVDGDNHRGRNNVGIVVPPGVAHAIRAEGSEDVIMVYGTSTSFRPEFEGRIASEIETAALPEAWARFLDKK
jgi:dTDP-4-dehydrorhamnose 3,5-epimerase-like enzyme